MNDDIKIKEKTCKSYISYIKEQIEKNKIVKISNVQNVISKALHIEYLERIYSSSVTEEDKITNNIRKLKEHFKNPELINNKLHAELLNYNLKNYTKIYLYRCLLQLPEEQWAISDLMNYDPNIYNKKSKAIILYVVKFFIIKLGFTRCDDFTTEITNLNIMELEDFIKINFWDIKKCLSAKQTKIPDTYTTIKSFICSILYLVGLNLNVKRCRSTESYIIKLEFINELFSKSIDLYIPLSKLTLNTIDAMYEKIQIL